MGKSTVHEVIQRAISDAAFRRQLQANPKKALGGFSLSPEETAAITSGDPARLTALGVDQRMSKAFALGAFGDASKGIIGDTIAPGHGASVDADAAGSGDAALVSPGVDDASPLVSAGDAYITDGLGSGVVRADLTGGAKPSAAVTAPEFDAQSGTGTISVDEGSISGTAARADLSAGQSGAGTVSIDEGSISGTSAAATTGAESAGQRHLRMVEQDLASGTAAVVGDTAESSFQRHLREVNADLDASSSATAFEPAGAPGTMSVDEGSISGSDWRAAPIEGSPEASESAATSEGESAGQSHLRRLEQDLDTGEATSGGGTADPTEY